MFNASIDDDDRHLLKIDRNSSITLETIKGHQVSSITSRIVRIALSSVEEIPNGFL